MPQDRFEGVWATTTPGNPTPKPSIHPGDALAYASGSPELEGLVQTWKVGFHPSNLENG
jgi:hypothetical protein